MNDRQRSKHDSNLAVRTVCHKEAHRALWNAVPAFVALHDRLLAKISYVNACSLIQTSNTTGITREKGEARQKMTESTLEVAGALCTLALLRGDTVLEAKADYDLTDLRSLPDSDVDDRATEVLTLARTLPAPPAGSPLPHLADVGLTEGKLDLLETRIETYNLLLGSPRAARGEKSAATVNLEATLDEIDRLLRKGLDKLMLQFRGTDFHTEYFRARDPIAVARPNQPATPGSTPA